jgi:hypothetical protein
MAGCTCVSDVCVFCVAEGETCTASGAPCCLQPDSVCNIPSGETEGTCGPPPPNTCPGGTCTPGSCEVGCGCNSSGICETLPADECPGGPCEGGPGQGTCDPGCTCNGDPGFCVTA